MLTLQLRRLSSPFGACFAPLSPSLQRCHSQLPSSRPRVVVGVSGGVDSSVSLALLKQEGYDVIGCYMQNWDEVDDEIVGQKEWKREKENDPQWKRDVRDSLASLRTSNVQCTSTQDLKDAQRVCEQLDVPFYHVDFVREYWNNVFTEFLDAYTLGYTPNPDIACNREIKFKAFLELALKRWDADFVATGHYARVRKLDNGRSALFRGLDRSKDQSYFLSNVTAEALSRVMFPLGEIRKSEVKKMAESLNLCTAKKRESMGICFIGKKDMKSFLEEYLPDSAFQSGPLISIEDRETVLGHHEGVHTLTIGQSARLGGMPQKWFVCEKPLLLRQQGGKQDTRIYVCPGHEHPALYVEEFGSSKFNWVGGVPPDDLVAGNTMALHCQVRYRQVEKPCTVRLETKATGGFVVHVASVSPIRAVTLGQELVLYDGEECLGGGVIDVRGKTLFEMGKVLPVDFNVAGEHV